MTTTRTNSNMPLLLAFGAAALYALTRTPEETPLGGGGGGGGATEGQEDAFKPQLPFSAQYYASQPASTNAPTTSPNAPTVYDSPDPVVMDANRQTSVPYTIIETPHYAQPTILNAPSQDHRTGGFLAALDQSMRVPGGREAIRPDPPTMPPSSRNPVPTSQYAAPIGPAPRPSVPVPTSQYAAPIGPERQPTTPSATGAALMSRVFSSNPVTAGAFNSAPTMKDALDRCDGALCKAVGHPAPNLTPSPDVAKNARTADARIREATTPGITYAQRRLL